MHPTAGTWKYRATDVIPSGTYHSTFSITIKDDGAAWTVNTAMEFPDGPVTDVSTLEKGTLILRRELFKHFPKPGQPWKPVMMNLDFTDNKVTGISTSANGHDTRVAVDLSGPVFADVPASEITIGCLPLADGYSATFRNWDVEKLALNPQAHNPERRVQLKVVGTERVTVPAGTFDSYKVELTPADGGPNKETVWIARDSRMPVKTYDVEVLRGVTTSTTTELVP
jgi:hypothetical protein